MTWLESLQQPSKVVNVKYDMQSMSDIDWSFCLPPAPSQTYSVCLHLLIVTGQI